MAMMRWSAIQAALNTAAHPGTGGAEAVSALRKANELLAKNGLALSDLKVDEGEAQTTPYAMLRRIEELESSVNSYARIEVRLTAENRTLKARVSELQSQLQAAVPAPVKPEPKPVRAGPKADKQYAFREVIMELADTPRVDSTPAEVAARRDAKREDRMRRGREPETPRPQKAAAASGEKGRSSPKYAWPNDLWRQAVDLYLSGKGKVEISKALARPDGSGPSAASVFAATSNAKPPSWLNAQVRASGPIDWPEAWLLGSAMFAEKRSWLGPTMEALKVNPPSKGLSFDLNAHADPDAVSALRKRYREQFHDQQRSDDAAAFEK